MSYHYNSLSWTLKKPAKRQLILTVLDNQDIYQFEIDKKINIEWFIYEKGFSPREVLYMTSYDPKLIKPE